VEEVLAVLPFSAARQRPAPPRSSSGRRRAIDLQVYNTFEIEQIGRVAFDFARQRRIK
jgi:isocitrate/isopropylmalate dehydrogenase